MKKLNVGCGRDIKKGYINLDRLPIKGIDIVHDLNKYPWPFKNNTFNFIYCRHMLEHLEDAEKALKEMCRILKDKGRIEIIIPHFTSSGAFEDLSHKHFFSYNTFDIYSLPNNTRFDYYYDYNGYSLYTQYKKIIFGKKYQVWNWIFEPLVNILPRIYENSFLRSFPAMELKVILVKGKRRTLE